jgi:hypothetical protein
VLFGFPYPPLSLLFAIPGQVLAADCRYGQLVAMTAAGALIAYSGRGRTPTLAAALLLFAPKSLFVLEQGWTEPYVVLLLAAVLFAARRRPGVVPWLVGLLLSSKQYLVLLAPSAALLMAGLRPRRSDLLRDYGKALGTAAVVTLPPALWDLPAFWHSTVWVHVRQPFRPDSLAFPGWLYARTGVWLDVWAAFAVALVAVAVVVWRGRGTPAEFAAASALTLGLFFAFSKQAFCNYYYLVVAAWCCAIAVSQTDTASRGSPDPR